ELRVLEAEASVLDDQAGLRRVAELDGGLEDLKVGLEAATDQEDVAVVGALLPLDVRAAGGTRAVDGQREAEDGESHVRRDPDVDLRQGPVLDDQPGVILVAELRRDDGGR